MFDWMDRPIQNEVFAKLIMPAQNVACVEDKNSAEHALLVLIKTRYSAIPVLSGRNRVVGTISKTIILDAILGLERIEVERLADLQVGNLMNTHVPAIQPTDTVRKAVQLSINQPFLCLVENDNFAGLVTRRALLAHIFEQTKVHSSKFSEKA
jgi:predicted transcriptional regulator